MAGDGDLLSELRAMARRLDDAALAALGSAGLLRRARKDAIEAAARISVEGDVAIVTLCGHRVVIGRGGLLAAKCSCRALSVCQHVIGAVLALAAPSDSAESTSGPSVEPEPNDSAVAKLLAFDLDAFEAFAGRSAVRDATTLVANAGPAAVGDGPTITVTLAGVPDVFRYAGGGLDAVICATRGRRRPMLVVAAVIAFQVSRGRPLPDVAKARDARGPADSPPAHAAARISVTRKCRAAIEECVTIGLTHLSSSVVDRFAALAVLADSVRLHRLSLALDRIKDGADALIERNARADSAGLLQACAVAYALCAAIPQAEPALLDRLAGRAQTAYDEIPPIELYGVAAYVWRSGSAREGLTMLLWSENQRNWWTWTDMRPRSVARLDVAERFRGPGPWHGGGTPASMIGRRLKLVGARSNAIGRLSGSATTRAVLGDFAEPPAFEGCRFDDWRTFDAWRAGTIEGVGLGVHDPRRDIVVLDARSTGTPTFDGASQTLRWPLHDRCDAAIDLTLKHSEITANAIARLEAFEPGRPVTVVAICESGGNRRVIRPVAFIDASAPQRIDCLDFDAPRLGHEPHDSDRHARLAQHLNAMAGRSADTLPESAAVIALTATEAELLNLAERGTAACADVRAAVAPAVASAVRSGFLLDRVDRAAAAAGVSGAERLLRLAFATRALVDLCRLGES